MTRPRKSKAPLAKPPKGVRQRELADGSWSVWWEPDVAARKAGFKPVRLDGDRPQWCLQRAAQINADVAVATTPNAPDRSRGQTVLDLIENYRRSRYWKELAPKTQKSYGALLSQIERKWGGEAVIAFTKPVMATWYEAIADTGKITLARQLIRMMSILFSRAEVIGWRAEGSNPCFKLKMKTPKRRSERATWAEMDAMVAKADQLGLPAIGTAVLLLALQGQRSTDVRKAVLSDFELVKLDESRPPQWVWTFERSKRGNEAALPLHPEVEARLRSRLLRAADVQDGPVCPRPDTGGMYSEDLFIKHFNRVRDELASEARKLNPKVTPAIEGLQMRDLRRTFGILARAGGASREDTADALGNTAGKDPALYDTYMPATVLTAGRAVQSIKRPAKGGGV